MFRPILPAEGAAGWAYLNKTYDAQVTRLAATKPMRDDRAYLMERLSKPMTADAFLNDKRLLRISLTAFGLSGEEWKRGFLSKVLKEAADPKSTFLARLNNPQYTAFANTFAPKAGRIAVPEATRARVADDYAAATFEDAVGAADANMRLALNYQNEIGSLARKGASQETIAYRLLANVPVRTLLETAAGIPASVRRLPIERQAEIFTQKLSRQFGTDDLARLAEPAFVRKVIDRFHALSTAADSGASTLGALASQNLFVSRSQGTF